MHSKRITRITRRVGVAALIVAAFNLGSVAGPDAVRADTQIGTALSVTQPYGGCKEAWIAPHSEGADYCRSIGWTVRYNLTVNPHKVIRHNAMRGCRTEDAGHNCIWLGEQRGNREGLTFWRGKAGRAHYVWPYDFTGPYTRWHWVKPGSVWDHIPGVNRTCAVRVGGTTYIVRPDGRVWTS